MKYGFPIYASCEVSEILKITLPMQRMKRYSVGYFNVVPFQVPHNGTECDGFIIQHEAIGKLLFMTDLEMCPFNMSAMKINNLMIECNYSEDYLRNDSMNKDHVLLGHMELQTCKRFIRTVYGENLKSIGLIHLSKENADPFRFREEIQSEFPESKVWIADKNLTVEV